MKETAESCGICGAAAPAQAGVQFVDGDVANLAAKNLVAVVTAAHPFVAVGRPDPQAQIVAAIEAATAAGETGQALASRIAAVVKTSPLIGVPCCSRCQAAPPAGLKVHFFPRADAPTALQMADRGALGLPAVPASAVAHAPGGRG